MLYREIIAVCSQIHTKHSETLCGQNVELLNAKPNGIRTYSNTMLRHDTKCLHKSFHYLCVMLFRPRFCLFSANTM